MTRIALSRRAELGLGLACVVLLAISLMSLPRQQLVPVAGALHAPWCLPDQSPSFEFGFAELNAATGDGVMGVPTECEHGTDQSNGDTSQKTTTGIATYSWCTNTPRFTRSFGQEHWMLTDDGLEHWVGGPDSPRPLPLVRAPDLRHLCLG